MRAAQQTLETAAVLPGMSLVLKEILIKKESYKIQF